MNKRWLLVMLGLVTGCSDGIQRHSGKPEQVVSRESITSARQQKEELPILFVDDQLDCVALIEAANYFIRQGEANTLRRFREILAMSPAEVVQSPEERIAWMCRILFVPDDVPIRAPLFGWHGGVDFDDSLLTTWPMYPIAMSGETFFVVAEKYRIAGMPESVKKYAEFCREHGSFRSEPLPIPDVEQRIEDAHQLGESDRWSELRGENYSMLQSQAAARRD